MEAAAYASLDRALEAIADYGPELVNGLTNHAPMAAEALCALGRPEAVSAWIDRYRDGLRARPSPVAAIEGEGWPAALGRPERFADWSVRFRAELAVEPWDAVVNRWIGRLAPGISADATHGIIRVGHAVRSLGIGVSVARVRELADGLALLAANYQELSTAQREAVVGVERIRGLRPREAIHSVPLIPETERRFSGTIVSSLDTLAGSARFAPVIGLLQIDGDTSTLLSELTETFGRVYLANARDQLTALVFIHGITSLAAVRSILPHLDDVTACATLGFAWQASAGLYATFGTSPALAGEVRPPAETPAALVDLAIAAGDEHAIKFTEACVREYAHDPSPVYLAAARSALDLLRSE